MAAKKCFDATKFVEDYLRQATWETKENSNISFSFLSLFFRSAGEMISRYTLDRVYPRDVARAHVDGDFHLHNLYMGITGYCCGWSLGRLLCNGFGGVQNRVTSLPPKHLDTALLQMVNFIGTVQNEWAGAQAFNSIDTYLAPFVKRDGLGYPKIKQAIQTFVYNLNVASRWGGQCVSADTEALTKDGWKRYDEITSEDKIATFNGGKIEYVKPERINVYDYDGELMRLKNRCQEQLLTPNHLVLRKKFNSKKFELLRAGDVARFKTPIIVPITAETCSNREIDNNLVRLFAWLVSEGTFSEGRGRISVYQSEGNEKNCNEIRHVFKKLGLKWDETGRIHGFSKRRTLRFRLSQESSRWVRRHIIAKEIPKIVKTLSKRQIRLFLDTYVKGDGHVESKGRIRIYTKAAVIRNQIQELCALCGYGTTNSMNNNNVWIVNIIRNALTNITKVSKIKYKGKVWCPTTKNGTFIARRQGKVFVTGNSPFTNITFDWRIPADLRDENVIIGGRQEKDSYGDFQHEADLINRAFIEVYSEGDAAARPFTFPIPIYNITRDFDWESENAKMLFEMAAKYGLPYFSNFISTGATPSDIRSMCCRLRLDMRQLKRNITGGLFGSADMTGSVGVVTINMPRIGYLARDEADFFERLDRTMGLAKKSLEMKRKVVSGNMAKGLLPYSRVYLGTLDNHFSTIGLIGMNEACRNFLGVDIAEPEGKKFAVKTLKHMLGRLGEFQKDTGNLYNLEATPAEGASYRLARLDKRKYPKIITAGKREPYYTNSTLLPANKTDDVVWAMRHQEDLQTLYTGGTVFHVLLAERMADGEACAKFVRKVFENTRLPYITITPSYSICQKHGYIVGEHFRCPTCGKPAEVYSRIVGYYRPVQNWNPGKVEEFRQRKYYDEHKALEKDF